MSLGNRLHQLAVRGCLIAGIVLLTAGVGPCESQESARERAPERPPAVENSQRIAVDPPAPKSESSSKAAGQDGVSGTPAAPTISEHGQVAAEPPCDRRCQEAEQREKDDLKAQETMARFTEDMARSASKMNFLTNTIVNLTYGQMAIGTAGLLALVITILLSVRATNAVVEANKIARENAVIELRAHVSILQINTDVGINAHDTSLAGWYVSVIWQNTGATHAQNLQVWHAIDIFEPRIPDDFGYENPLGGVDSGIALGPNSNTPSGGAFISLAKVERARNGNGEIWIWGRATYRDVFPTTEDRYVQFAVSTRIEKPISSDPSTSPFTFRVAGPFNASN